MYGARLELVICKDQPKLYRLNANNEFIFIKDLKMNEKARLMLQAERKNLGRKTRQLSKVFLMKAIA